MPASSLLQMARKLCIANIRFITDVGDVPYTVARPILLKVESADQLKQIEESSPQICGHDAEVWRELIKRDVTNWAEKCHEPENPRDWYQLYQNLQAESQMEVEADATNLRDTLLGITSERLKHQSKHVHPSTVPPLPKMGAMKLIKTPRKKKIVFVDHRPKLSFNAGSKTKVLTARGVMDKARREAKEQSLFYSGRSVLAVPTHKLKGSKSQIQTAPKGLVDDHQHQHRFQSRPEPIDPTVKPPPIFAPKRKREEPAESSAPYLMSLEEKERRLKALTTSRKDTAAASSPAAQSRSDSNSSTAPRVISHPQKTSILSSATPTSKVTRSQQLPPANPRRVPPPTRTKAPVNPFMPAKRRKLT